MKPRITETDIHIIDDWLREMAEDPAKAFISHTDDETKIIVMQIRQLFDEQQKEIDNWIEAYSQY